MWGGILEFRILSAGSRHELKSSVTGAAPTITIPAEIGSTMGLVSGQATICQLDGVTPADTTLSADVEKVLVELNAVKQNDSRLQGRSDRSEEAEGNAKGIRQGNLASRKEDNSDDSDWD